MEYSYISVLVFKLKDLSTSTTVCNLNHDFDNGFLAKSSK